MATSSSQKMSGSGKGRGRKKNQPGRGMGVAQLERIIRTQQQQQHHHHQFWKLPLPPRPHPAAIVCHDDPSVVHTHLTAAGELPSFPNVCCAHHNYLDFNTFPFSRLKGEGEGEGAQVLAVHDKGGKGADRKLVMEYGFFPVASSGAAASSSAPGYATTSMDLSLRL